MQQQQSNAFRITTKSGSNQRGHCSIAPIWVCSCLQEQFDNIWGAVYGCHDQNRARNTSHLMTTGEIIKNIINVARCHCIWIDADLQSQPGERPVLSLRRMNEQKRAQSHKGEDEQDSNEKPETADNLFWEFSPFHQLLISATGQRYHSFLLPINTELC